MLVELNLVPFIDYMSCLIAFLMMAAVWTNPSSLNIEQAVGPSGELDETSDPLTVHIRSEAVWLGLETRRLFAANLGGRGTRRVRFNPIRCSGRDRSALNDLHERHHDGHDEKDVDESSHRVRGDKAQSPQYQQDDSDGPKHGISYKDV